MNIAFEILLLLVSASLCSSSADSEEGSKNEECPYMCPNSDKCLDLRRVCNGRRDCKGGADELNCEDRSCSGGAIKCRDGRQCVFPFNYCDGFEENCDDKSDEDEEVCRQWQCSAGKRMRCLLKCRDGLQCAPMSHFCYKGHRSTMQYRCRDFSDETIWGCGRVNITCSRESDLWPCGPEDDSECVHITKVCDGESAVGEEKQKRGLSNNCPNGADEDPEMCRTFECTSSRVKCADQRRCIRVIGLCNGDADCEDGSDETALVLPSGLVNNCTLRGSPCLSISRTWWLDDPRPGARCGPRSCVERAKFCDGTCHCPDDDCFDEDPSFCLTWNCTEGFFKCHTTGLCIPRDKVCDGQFDCESDSSDEADCLCEESDHVSVYFRQLLVPLLSLHCANDSSRVDPDKECLFKAIIHSQVIDNRTVEITASDMCGLAPCTLDTFELSANDRITIRLGSAAASHRRDRRTGGFFASVTMPMAAGSGYRYEFNKRATRRNSEDNKLSCLRKPLMSHKIEERLFASLMLSDPSAPAARVCECHFPSVGRVELFNEYRLPSPFYNEMRSYFYNTIDKTFGQFELLFSSDKHCSLNPLSSLPLNDVYPTITYGAGMVNDDKNIPLKAFFYSPPRKCAKLTSDKHVLLTLLSFAKSGVMKTAEGSPWITVTASDHKTLQSIVCHAKSVSFQYAHHRRNVTFLVLSPLETELEMDFLVANQRTDLYDFHQLRNKNFTSTIRVLVRRVTSPRLLATGNSKLFYELFIANNFGSSLNNFEFVMLQMPRDHRDYAQSRGNRSLGDALSDIGVRTNLTFFRVCKKVEKCPYDSLRDNEHIATALAARWSRKCLNVTIGNNDYYILASEVDTYYIMINRSYTMLVGDPEIRVQGAELKTTVLTGPVAAEHGGGNGGDGSAARPEDAMKPQTRLVEINGQIYCPNPLVKNYTNFYVPTMVSAHISKNERCHRLLCSSRRKLYLEQGGIRFLGPFHEIWHSSCFEEFGYELIASIYEARDNGLLTMNKFWAFEHFNYLVFALDVPEHERLNQIESSYLSSAAYGIEIFLGTLMALICLVAIFGNLFVFFAILVDPVTRKSVYQYFQMSLCLADVLMGMAGAGSIVFTQFSLLFGSMNIYDFIEADAFTATFEQPEQSKKSGLNQFYFMTAKPGLVACGAFVSLSTTVSLLLLTTMAYTRYQVVASSASQHSVFRWASKHPVAATTIPWTIGIFFTLLYFIDIDNFSWSWRAFFDPVSKITILLPSNSNPIIFFIQTTFSALVSLLTVVYSIRAWMAINENAKNVRSKGMITQRHHLLRRVSEERKWLHLTLAIIFGFVVSVLPVFVFYLLSVFHVRTPPYVELAVWWLLISGSFINLVIYTSLNDSMKKSITHAVEFTLFKLGLRRDDPRPSTAFYSGSGTKRTTLGSRQESIPLTAGTN